MGWNTTLLKKKKQKKRKRENTTRNRINVASGRVFPAELYFEVLPKILKSPRKRQTTREGTVQGNEQLSMATDATRERRSVRWKNRRTSNWERLFFIFLEKKKQQQQNNAQRGLVVHRETDTLQLDETLPSFALPGFSRLQQWRGHRQRSKNKEKKTTKSHAIRNGAI